MKARPESRRAAAPDRRAEEARAEPVEPDRSAAPALRARRVDAAFLGTLVLLLLALRGALALRLGDVFFYGEELEKGALAKALVDGIPVEWHRLNYHYFEGGSMTVSHVTAVAFLLFGQSLLALKLVALGTNVLILTAGCLLARYAFGRAAAACFGLLFVLAPAAIQQVSLLTIGHHYENQLFVFLILLCLLRLLFAEDPGRGRYAALGVSSGFGLYFSLGNGAVLALALLALLVLRPRLLFRRRVAWALGGFLVGAAPLLWMLTRVGAQVLDVHGIHLADPGDAEEVGSFAGSVRSIYLGRDALDTAAVLAATLLPLAGLLFAARRRGTRFAEAFAVLAAFELVLLSLYAASPFTSGPLTHHFFVGRLSLYWGLGLLLGAGAFGAALEARRRWERALGIVPALVLAVAGALHFREALGAAQPGAFGSRWETLVRTKGYDYVGYFANMKDHLDGTLLERTGPLFEYDEPAPGMLLAAIAEVFLDDRRFTLPAAIEACRRLGGERWRLLAAGLGPYLRARYRNDLPLALAELQGSELDDETQRILAFALGRSGFTRRGTTKNLDAELRQVGGPLAGELRAELHRGFGHRLYAQFPLDRPAALAWIADLPAPVAARVGRGYLEARDENALPR